MHELLRRIWNVSLFQQCYLFTLRFSVKNLRCGKSCSYDDLLQVYSTSTCVFAKPPDSSCLWYIAST